LDEIRALVEQWSKTPKGALWFLGVALSESHSWGGDHRVRYYINPSTIERFGDLERIKILAGKLNRKTLSKKELIALRELEKAVQRRAEGRSDDAWRANYPDEDEEIVD
jgi:hypothetical protein